MQKFVPMRGTAGKVGDANGLQHKREHAHLQANHIQQCGPLPGQKHICRAIMLPKQPCAFACFP